MKKRLRICCGEKIYRVINVDTELTDEDLIKSIDIVPFIRNKIKNTKVLNIVDVDEKNRYKDVWEGEK